MHESYIRNLLRTLSVKLGRRPEEMELFILKLEGQWYDSKDSLKKLTPEDYARLQIPERLAMMIAEAVGVSFHQKMDVQAPIEVCLGTVKDKVNPKDFEIIVETLHRIFNNIRQNLISEKYRTLKKSNGKIAALTSIPEVVKALNFGGFEDHGSAFVMTKLNIESIDECIDSISKFMPKAVFNPYESHTISNRSQPVNYESTASMQYNSMLEKLEGERMKIMSQPIQNRRIAIYKIQPQFHKEFDRKFQEGQEEREDNQIKHIEFENIKNMLKRQGEEPKFLNRRQLEYQQLVKVPVFSETIIRVKLPDDWIFECTFSPMETLHALVDVFNSCLINANEDYYLYMTPPVQKLSGKVLKKTFYDLGCIPRAVFYMKYEQQLKTNIFKINQTHMNF